MKLLEALWVYKDILQDSYSKLPSTRLDQGSHGTGLPIPTSYSLFGQYIMSPCQSPYVRSVSFGLARNIGRGSWLRYLKAQGSYNQTMTALMTQLLPGQLYLEAYKWFVTTEKAWLYLPCTSKSTCQRPYILYTIIYTI